MVKRNVRKLSRHTSLGVVLFTAIFFVLSGCSGGGSSSDSGDVSALSLPDRIQLSNVDDDANRAAGLRMSRAAECLRAWLGDVTTGDGSP